MNQVKRGMTEPPTLVVHCGKHIQRWEPGLYAIHVMIMYIPNLCQQTEI